MAEKDNVLLGIIVLCIFFLVGLCVAVFARKIALWWGGQLRSIFRVTGLDRKLPWARGNWPFSFEFFIVFLRIIGIILTIGAIYIFCFVLL